MLKVQAPCPAWSVGRGCVLVPPVPPFLQGTGWSDDSPQPPPAAAPHLPRVTSELSRQAATSQPVGGGGRWGEAQAAWGLTCSFSPPLGCPPVEVEEVTAGISSRAWGGERRRHKLASGPRSRELTPRHRCATSKAFGERL